MKRPPIRQCYIFYTASRRYCFSLLVGSLMAGVASAHAQQGVSRTNEQVASLPVTPLQDVYSDTWVATDALGRTLPMAGEVGLPRRNKFVGMFYFLWLGQHGTRGPYDITKILAQDPTAINNPQNLLWGALSAPHHWGEPAFGYYLSDDEWVLRKHAHMLAAAGVDTVFFDVTNQFTYPQSYLALCRVWSQIRREGGTTPQIAFLAPFGDPGRVVSTLYNDFYKPGLYADLWFRWEGKPLVMADPRLIRPQQLLDIQRAPAELEQGHSLGQSFTATQSFTAVGGSFPTYRRQDSGLMLSLYSGGPGGKLLATQSYERVVDNANILLKLATPLPPGRYYLEITQPVGQIGWWSYSGDVYAGGAAFTDGVQTGGDRALSIVYASATTAAELAPSAPSMTPATAEDEVRQMQNFFTFRKPQPDYFAGPHGPGDWGWLEVYPQHAFYQTPGVPEQVTVGVAQNAVDGKLSVLSNPRSHGRSFHDGQEPTATAQDNSGRNFAEQWQRALSLDPSFIFVTGWNEWVAGRFGTESPFYASSAVNFVDEFNQEYSRDIEPMRDGHTDNYYYQLVNNIRRFKGARPLPIVHGWQSIVLRRGFGQWQTLGPEYRDPRGDTQHRDWNGWSNLHYRNTSGRNDIVLSKVACDRDNIYFYARTAQPLTRWNDANWMRLFIDADQNPRTGWHGYDYVINQRVLNQGATTVARWQPGGWTTVGRVHYLARGAELQIAIPRQLIGQTNLARTTFDFHWLDNVGLEQDIATWWESGDSAPDGRFNYRYENLHG